jgi:Acyl-CoA thioester hydrolase/BAAT N-terminal region
LECAGNTATKCVAIGNRRHSLLLIIVGYFVRAAATFLFPGREMSTSESRIFLDFRLFVAQNGPAVPVSRSPFIGVDRK